MEPDLFTIPSGVTLRPPPKVFDWFMASYWVWLAGVAFLSNLAQVALGSTVVIYAMHRFGWTTGRVGVTLAVTGVAMALVYYMLSAF